jgi:hypothetical protein
MILLISNKAMLLGFVPVAATIDFDSIRPDLEDAAELFIKPEIGSALLQELFNKIDDSSELWKGAIFLTRRAIANFAIAKYIPKLSINITGSGVTRSESEQSKTAYRYQEENAIQSYLSAAENSLELLLKLCEEKATELSWTGPELTFLKENHLPTADAYSQVIDIGNSRRIYRKLKPQLKVIQQSRILSNIGKELNDKILTDDQEGHYIIIQSLVRQALANLAMAEVLPVLNLKMEENGVSFISTAASGDNALRHSPVPTDYLNNLVLKYKNAGEIQIKQLMAYLQKHAAEITEFSSNAEIYDPEFKPFKNDPETGGAKLF